MADYELQGEITTNTIDSEILSAPIIESEMMLGDTVVIDHYYNGLESDTVKVTVDNDNNTIKADVNVGASVLDFAESEYNKSKNLFDENKYLSSYCTYASNRWTTNSTRIGYNQSILTNETGATDNRNTSKLPLLKKGTYTLTIFNTVNNTNDTAINIALYNQDGTIKGTFTTATITTNTTITFTMASDLYLDIRVNGNVGTISFDHIQIEEGSIATAYYPYSGAITHNGDAAVDFAESEYQKSKNLLTIVPFSQTINGITITANNDIITINGTTTAFTTINKVHNLIKVNIGKYVLSLKHISGTISGNSGSLTLYNKVIKNELAYPALSVVDNITEETASDKLYIAISIGITFDNFKYQLQYEAGSSATDYQPYNGAIVHKKQIADVEHIETIYDMSSSDSNINKGYTAGKQFDDNATEMPIDLGNYKKLRLCFKLYKQTIVYFDFGIPNNTYFTMCAVCIEPTYSVNNPIMLSVYYSNGNLKCYKAVLGISAGGGNLNNSDNAVLIKVQGVK